MKNYFDTYTIKKKFIYDIIKGFTLGISLSIWIIINALTQNIEDDIIKYNSSNKLHYIAHKYIEQTNKGELDILNLLNEDTYNLKQLKQLLKNNEVNKLYW